ncbi:MAG TPA: hypothetical protein VGX76_06310, partial [Pirellulales bacterium]|nr:hypothetical protein [Pirellulales bacterium]
MKKWFLGTLAGLALLVWPVRILAADDELPDEEAAKEVLDAATSHMRRMTMSRTDDERGKIELLEKPLLSFGDSARVYNHGTLWTWQTKGRPVAFLELFQGPQQNSRWIHAVSLSGPPNVALDIPSAGRWQPKTTKFEPAALADAPTLAAR